jgi:tetratricopeptide (TPR) repeat protein
VRPHQHNGGPQQSPPVSAPIPRAGHGEAVALYEQGVAALQAHEFARASAVLRSVLSRYPEERELHERVRLYLNVCERHMAPRAAFPTTPEERVFAATLAVNAGNYDEALDHLRTASSEAPEHDHALYMLASVLALRDALDEAVPLLLRAIELNPDNRTLARHDPDLEALREFESVRVALEASSPPKTDRRKPLRRR